MEIKHILFDLDGTLLPMKQDEFVEYYLPILAKRFVGRGVDAKAFIGYIWKGFAAMVANDGRCTNEEVFWKCFLEKMPISHEEMVKDTIDFYSGDFNQAIASTQPSPVSGEISGQQRRRAYRYTLLQIPYFPVWQP